MRLGGPQSRSGCVGEDKFSFSHYVLNTSSFLIETRRISQLRITMHEIVALNILHFKQRKEIVLLFKQIYYQQRGKPQALLMRQSAVMRLVWPVLEASCHLYDRN